MRFSSTDGRWDDRVRLNRVLGWFFALAAVACGAYYAAAYSSGAQELLWFCNAALILSSAAFFKKSPLLVSAILLAALPAQFFWVAGNLLYFFGVETFGRYRWLNHEAAPVGLFFESIYHFSVIPAAVYGVWKFGYHRHGLPLSIGVFISLLLVTYFVTDPVNNVNCMFYPCDMEFDPATMHHYGLRYALLRCAGFALAGCVEHALLWRFLPAGFKKG